MKYRLLAGAGIATALFFAMGFWVYALMPRPVDASRNSSGTMSAINGPYTAGSVISSSVINARLADIETELTDSKSRSGKGDFSAPVRAADGTVTAPAFAFTSETGTGLYRIGSSDLGLSINQSKKLELTSSLFTVTPAMTVTGATTLSSTLAVTGTSTLSDVLTANISGTASTFLASFFEASLANGNSGTLAVGKANSANASVGLQFNPNATAANSTGCLVVNGQTGTLCVDGNNKASAAGALVVTGATTATGGITIGSSGTATAQMNFGSCTLNAGSPATCTATVASGAKCVISRVGGSASSSAFVVAVSGTTMTVTESNGSNYVVNYICFG